MTACAAGYPLALTRGEIKNKIYIINIIIRGLVLNSLTALKPHKIRTHIKRKE